MLYDHSEAPQDKQTAFKSANTTSVLKRGGGKTPEAAKMSSKTNAEFLAPGGPTIKKHRGKST